MAQSEIFPAILSNLLTVLICKRTTRILPLIPLIPMPDLTPTERQAAMIADLEARLEVANEKIFYIASQNYKLRAEIKLLCDSNDSILHESEHEWFYTRMKLAVQHANKILQDPPYVVL
jgi:hypothetical protein